MNHQRFEHPESGRGSYERERYPRGRGFGGGRNEDYDDMDTWRTGRGYDEEYRGRQGYGAGRMGEGPDYGGMRSDERERDRYGRFVNEGDGRGYGRSMSGLQGSYEMPRDDQGRFTSMRSGGYRPAMGRHTGRGPKNYQRSDERIREDVCDRLEQDGDIDASEMEIKVQNGLVTLSGSVESREEKHMAEQLAEECSGVKDVQNQLKVSGRQGEHGKMGNPQHSDQKEHARKSA
jgi:hypothetical protein